jgi:hypothetical protein
MGMVKERIENCFPLSLDALPGPSESNWVVRFDVTVQLSDRGSRESADYRMLVRRRENKLTVILQRVGSPYRSLRQLVTIDPRRRGGYREFLVCPRCGGRFRCLFFPWGTFLFQCRICHDLAYQSQSRDRNALERVILRDQTFGRRRPRPLGKAAHTALLAAARSPDPAAMDAFARRLGRPPKTRASSTGTSGRPRTKRKYKRGAYDKQKCGWDEAYCVKCRLPRRTAQPFYTEFSNGRPAMAGVCAVCGTKCRRATRRKDLSVK